MSINNPKDRKELLIKAPLLSEIHKEYGAPPSWSRPPGFTSLVKIIIEQQVSISSAQAHYQRLSDYTEEVKPENLLSLSDLEFRQCHISRQKRDYLRALSDAVVNRELVIEKLPKIPEAESKKQLLAIKGIGNWTADIYLMLCLQKADIFPIGDIAVRTALKELNGMDDPSEMIALAEEWRPLRSLATFYLWHYYLEKRGRKLPW